MRRVFLAAAVALALCGPRMARAVDPAEAAITYVTTSTVYVDAGTGAGLAKGDVVKVFRDGVFVTALEVTAISTKRAACRRADPTVELVVGDRIRFHPAAPRTEEAAEEGIGPSSARTEVRRP